MMNTTPADEAILKTDVLGRMRTPRERREELLDEFERSGVSGPQIPIERGGAPAYAVPDLRE